MYEYRPCPQCGAEHLLDTAEQGAPCFACWRAANPVSLPNVRIDAAGDDSSDPSRVADGTAKFNSGLRGVEIDTGRRKNGKAALDYRPITNHEVGSNANRRELAKRQGLGVYEPGIYRGLR